MRSNQLFTLSLTSLLIVGAMGALSSTSAQTLDINHRSSFVIAAQPKVVRTGSFVKAEQPTQGSVRITSESGKTYLDLDSKFKTSDQGPDLYVILYRTANPPIEGIKEKDYVIVGKLQKFSGAQKYEIPASTNLKNFASAAIWCRKFNATFGYAKLN